MVKIITNSKKYTIPLYFFGHQLDLSQFREGISHQADILHSNTKATEEESFQYISLNYLSSFMSLNDFNIILCFPDKIFFENLKSN